MWRQSGSCVSCSASGLGTVRSKRKAGLEGTAMSFESLRRVSDLSNTSIVIQYRHYQNSVV